MPVWMRLQRAWRNVVHREHVEQDLDEELRAYLDLLSEENRRRGMSPEQARREALMEVGSMDSLKEQVRDVSAGHLIHTLGQDIRQSLRSMTRNAATTALAIVTLTLGIGASAAIFSVFYSLLLRPLPFAEPERLVQIWETRLDRNVPQASFTAANFWDIRAQRKTFDEIAAYHSGDANLTGFGAPEHVALGRVSAGFWRVLGVRPVLGRDFLYEEDQPKGQNQVALLRHRFWRTRFNGDPGIVGRTLRLDDKPYLVIGVLPPGEPWLDAGDIFVPFVQSSTANRGSWEYSVIGRMSRGVTIEAARADLQAICSRLAELYPREDTGIGITMQPASVWIAGDDLRRALWVLLGAVGLLLLIACVNVANLLLARAAERTREMAIRSALGASRGRITRLLLTESMMLAGVAGLLGVLLAAGAVAALRSVEIASIPRLSETSLNGWVLGFTLAATVLTGLLTGLAPAFPLRADANVALHEGGRTQTAGRSQSRLRAVLVAGEVALSIALLVGAGLLIRSFDRLTGVQRGFQSDHRLLFTVNIPGSTRPERTWQLVTGFQERAQAMPDILSIAASSARPITGGNTGMGIVAADHEDAFGKNIPWAGWRMITPTYFETFGIPLEKGRVFDGQDQIAKPWRVILSHRLAERLFPDRDPIGRQVSLWKGQGNLQAEVIGVVGNMRERGLASDPTLTVYLPQQGTGWTSVEFVAHTRGDPKKTVPGLRSALAEVDATLPISNIQTVDELVSSSLTPNRFRTVLLGVFAGLALLLATTGIYGVLAYSISRRTSEFGLRLALGASRRGILGMTVRQGMRPVILGILAGAMLAWGLSRSLTALLFGVERADWLTYSAVVVLVGVTALAACCLPAMRATRVDPATALRVE